MVRRTIIAILLASLAILAGCAEPDTGNGEDETETETGEGETTVTEPGGTEPASNGVAAPVKLLPPSAELPALIGYHIDWQ